MRRFFNSYFKIKSKTCVADIRNIAELIGFVMVKARKQESVCETGNEIKHHSNSFLLCSTYRPPNSSVSSWDDLNVSIEYR